VIGALPRRAPTRTLVEAVRRRLERDPAGTREKLERLGRLADGAIALLECETPVSRPARAGRGEPGGNCAGEGLWRPERLGELAVQAQGVLRELDLSTPELEEILKLGMRAGALGGKLSGAGGGGAFYLVAGDRPAALDLAERIEYCLRKHWRGTRAPFLAAAWCPVGRPGARSLRPIPG
jgi:mevalonate kinase